MIWQSITSSSNTVNYNKINTLSSYTGSTVFVDGKTWVRYSSTTTATYTIPVITQIAEEDHFTIYGNNVSESNYTVGFDSYKSAIGVAANQTTKVYKGTYLSRSYGLKDGYAVTKTSGAGNGLNTLYGSTIEYIPEVRGYTETMVCVSTWTAIHSYTNLFVIEKGGKSTTGKATYGSFTYSTYGNTQICYTYPTAMDLIYGQMTSQIPSIGKTMITSQPSAGNITATIISGNPSFISTSGAATEYRDLATGINMFNKNTYISGWKTFERYTITQQEPWPTLSETGTCIPTYLKNYLGPFVLSVFSVQVADPKREVFKTASDGAQLTALTWIWSNNQDKLPEMDFTVYYGSSEETKTSISFYNTTTLIMEEIQ